MNKESTLEVVKILKALGYDNVAISCYIDGYDKALSELREFVGKTMSKNPMTKEEVGWNYACLRITEHIDKAIDSRRTA